jgi:carbon storage regulator
MLVLSRRLGESLVIGDDIVISVLEVKGDVVRIGVDAPRSVQVRRKELLEEVAATNQSAASPTPAAVAGLSRLVGSAKTGSDDRATPRPSAAGDTGAQSTERSEP